VGDCRLATDRVDPDAARIDAELVGATVRVARRSGPDWRGQSRPLGRDQLLGVLLHELGHALGFSGHARRGDTVMVREVDAVRRVAEAGLADGFIFDLTRPQDERVKYLLEHDLPFVTFGRTELFTPHAYLDVDNEDAAFQAAALLLRRGHRRIALIDRSLDYLYTRQRLSGFRRAHSEAGVTHDPALMTHGDLGAAGSRDAALAMCQLPDPPAGFVSANEVATLGILAGLRAAGRGPGTGLDVVSRDGTRLTAYLDPPVSACFYSLYAAGRRLADFLLRRIEGEPAGSLQEIVRTELIERG